MTETTDSATNRPASGIHQETGRRATPTEKPRDSARQASVSGRNAPAPGQAFNFLPDEPGGEHRHGWIARVSQVALPFISYGVALIYLISGGVLLVLIAGSDERLLTGVLVIVLGVLLGISGVATLAFALRTRSAIRSLRRAQQLVREGNEAEAIPALTQLLADGRLPGVRHITRFLLGKALAATGRTAEAKDAWKACEGFWPAWNNLGAMLLEEGRLHQAERAFRYAIKLNPGEPLLYNHLALTLQRRSEPVLARQVLELSLKHARSAATRRNLDRLDNGQEIDVHGILPRLRMPGAGWL